MGRDTTIDKLWLYRKIGDDEVPWLELVFRSDFVERMNTEYGHLGFPALFSVIKP